MMLGNRGTRKDTLLDELLDVLADSDMAVIPALLTISKDGSGSRYGTIGPVAGAACLRENLPSEVEPEFSVDSGDER